MQLIKEYEDEITALDTGADLLPDAVRQWLAKCRTQTAEIKHKLTMQDDSKDRQYVQAPLIGKYDSRI